LLVQVAWAASRKRQSYFRALFTRLTARRGPRKAIVAVAAAVLTAVYWMLTRAVAFKDLGADHFDRIQRPRLVARFVQKPRRTRLRRYPCRAEGRVIVSF
jgi:transposase